MKEKILQIKAKIDKSIAKREYISYREVPYLKEIIALLECNKDTSKESLEFVYLSYLYVGEMYERLERLALSPIYLERALQVAVQIKELFGTSLKGIQDLCYKLLRDRNFYIDDDCEDLKPMMEKVLSHAVVESLFKERMTVRRSLKHDPVEMTKEYLDVIDEVEEKIEKNRTLYGMGSCHEVWMLKSEYLMEKGIKWKSPAWLNPRVMFD